METLYFLEAIRNPYLTYFFRFCTFFGEEIFLIAAICIIYWSIDKKLAYKIGLVYFISGILVQGLKITVRADRPWIADKSFKAVDEAMTTATGYSFPSGHTQGAAAMYGSLFLYIKKTLPKILCLTAVTGVAVSRLYLGVHTLSDVICALFISFIILLVFYFIPGKNENNNFYNTLLSVVLSVLSVLLASYALILLNSGIIEYKYVSDCAKAAGAGMGFGAGWFLEHKYINFKTKTNRIITQFVKCILGLAVAFIIKEGLKILLHENIISDMLRYFLSVVWVLAAYPALFKKVLFSRKDVG